MSNSGIDCLGLARVIKRGTGEILAESDRLMLVCDSVSGAYMLACEDMEDRHARSGGLNCYPTTEIEGFPGLILSCFF